MRLLCDNNVKPLKLYIYIYIYYDDLKIHVKKKIDYLKESSFKNVCFYYCTNLIRDG